MYPRYFLFLAGKLKKNPTLLYKRLKLIKFAREKDSSESIEAVDRPSLLLSLAFRQTSSQIAAPVWLNKRIEFEISMDAIGYVCSPSI